MTLQEWLNVITEILVDVLIIVVPILITWFIRTFVRASTAKNDIAAILQLSNNAIDFVENLDNQEKLEIPEQLSKGVHKLRLAGEWLERELARAGIKMTDEEAQQWIASEFQKRVGGITTVSALAKSTSEAANLILNLDQRGLVDFPPTVDRVTHLAGLGADWLVVQLAKQGTSIPRERAMAEVKAELVQKLYVEGGELLRSDSLENLAQLAVTSLEELKTKSTTGKLSIQPGTPDADVEKDMAIALLMTEAAKRGLAATPHQIDQAVTTALQQRKPKPA